MEKITNLTIIGAGSWGTGLAIYLSQKYKIYLWGRDKNQIEYMKTHRKNPKYLKEFKLNENIIPTSNLKDALDKAEIVINAIPTQQIRKFYIENKDFFKNKIIINTSKGIENETLKLIDEIFFDIFNTNDNFVTLSGPTFAKEIAQGKPSAATVSSYNEELGKTCQKIINSEKFRIYFEPDVKGVLLGGALKNVIAIAAGIIEGLSLGLNSLAALITRALAEIRRLGTKLGANSLTFSGLSGLGDLVLTCYGNLSRNRKAGILLSKGYDLKRILKEIGEVAEGIYTSKSAYNLSKKLNVDMPITKEVYKIIYEGKSPIKALQDLMKRDLKYEKD